MVLVIVIVPEIKVGMHEAVLDISVQQVLAIYNLHARFAQASARGISAYAALASTTKPVTYGTLRETCGDLNQLPKKRGLSNL